MTVARHAPGSRKPSLLAGLLGLGVGISASALVFTRTSTPTHAAGATGASSTTTARADAEEFQALKRESERVSRELAAIRLAQQAQAERAPVAANSEPPAPPPAAAAVEATTPEALQAAERQYRVFADAQLAEQAVDHAWSEARALGSKLATALPAGSGVDSLDCRSALCRVVTSHRDMDAYRGFLATAFAFQGAKHIWDGPARLIVDEPATAGGPVRATMYLGRDELPALPRPADTQPE